MQLHVKITQDQSAALLKLKDAGAKLLRPLAVAFGSGAQEVLGRAVKNRFTGKGPFPVGQHKLGVRTNRLRKAMRATAPQVDAARGRITVSAGANVSYYAAHEFGFRGRVQVKQHTRNAVAGISRNARGAADKPLTRGQISKLKGVMLVRGRSSGGSTVRAHSRRVNIPARRPLGTELASVATRLTFFSKFNAVFRKLLSSKS